MILAMAIRSMYRINDQFFVQELGVLAQSAAAVGSMVAIWLFAFGELIHVGNVAVTSRRLGEGNTERAESGKLTKTQSGEKDWTPYYVIGGIICYTIG